MNSLGGAPKRVTKQRELGSLQQLVEHHCPSGVSEVESLPPKWLSKSEEGTFSGGESDCAEALLSLSSSSINWKVVRPSSAPKRLTSSPLGITCIVSHHLS